MMDNAHVVVLHGWGLSSYATQYWYRRLKQAGFSPSSFAYPSLSRSLSDNTAKLAAHINSLSPDRPVHLVGHSLGGIIIMQCLSQYRFAKLGRVVMVGSPFQGSSAMQRLKATRYGHFLLGKTIVQWRGVDTRDLPKDIQVGTIAGTSPYGMGIVFGQLEPPHDGTVTLAETHVPFASDRLVMKVTHSEMLISPGVTQQIISFLRAGRFSRP
jgi:pimeloyl-ACP methyl ester carboxylesterase